MCFKDLHKILGERIFKIESGRWLEGDPTQHFTIIFAVLCLMILFNTLNARKVNGEKNVFEVSSNFFKKSFFSGFAPEQIALRDLDHFVHFANGHHPIWWRMVGGNEAKLGPLPDLCCYWL